MVTPRTGYPEQNTDPGSRYVWAAANRPVNPLSQKLGKGEFPHHPQGPAWGPRMGVGIPAFEGQTCHPTNFPTTSRGKPAPSPIAQHPPPGGGGLGLHHSPHEGGAGRTVQAFPPVQGRGRPIDPGPPLPRVDWDTDCSPVPGSAGPPTRNPTMGPGAESPNRSHRSAHGRPNTGSRGGQLPGPGLPSRGDPRLRCAAGAYRPTQKSGGRTTPGG